MNLWIAILFIIYNVHSCHVLNTKPISRIPRLYLTRKSLLFVYLIELIAKVCTRYWKQSVYTFKTVPQQIKIYTRVPLYFFIFNMLTKTIQAMMSEAILAWGGSSSLKCPVGMRLWCKQDSSRATRVPQYLSRVTVSFIHDVTRVTHISINAWSRSLRI